MQERQRSPLVMCVLIVNSILLGVMVIALLCALLDVSVVVDQWVGPLSVPWSTQWVFDHTPRNVLPAFSLVVGVVATGLFFSFAFPSGVEVRQRTTLHLLFTASFCLVAVIYFFFSITVIITALIHTDMGISGSCSHSSGRLSPVELGSFVWVIVASVYALVLLIIGLRLRRKERGLRGSSN